MWERKQHGGRLPNRLTTNTLTKNVMTQLSDWRAAPNLSLHGKAIVVTGAESGIGREIARACAAAGARVAVGGLQAAGLDETVALIVADAAVGGRAQPEAFAMAADVSDASQIRSFFNEVQARFGTLDGAVCNAGVLNRRAPAIELSVEEWQRTIAVNLSGTFLTLTEAARIMMAHGRGGSLVATGSSSAIRGITGMLPYIASKAGVHAMVQALALELGPHGIRVNTLVPGTTETPLTLSMPGYLAEAAAQLPMREVVQTAELARFVLFALSDAAPHMTGTLLKIDSGRTIG